MGEVSLYSSGVHLCLCKRRQYMGHSLDGTRLGIEGGQTAAHDRESGYKADENDDSTYMNTFLLSFLSS